MPPPATGRSSPGPSAACRPEAQELRTGLSSDSLRFLTPGRAKGADRLWVQRAGPAGRRGSAEAFSNKKIKRPESPAKYIQYKIC